MKKLLLVHGWFLQPGVRINCLDENGLPPIYNGNGFWMYHGKFFFKGDEDFEGAIYDRCGVAVVRGTLKNLRLVFDKFYTHRSDKIRYELTGTVVRNEFSGQYNGMLVGTGITKLVITEPSRTFFEV